MMSQQLDPRYSAAIALLQQQRFAEAVNLLAPLVAAHPENPDYAFTLARAHQQLNQHDLAVKALANAKDSRALLARAISQEALGLRRDADSSYRAALAESALRPKNSAAIQLRYAQFLLASGNAEAALWQLNQCIRKQPFEGLAWLEKTRALLLLDRPAEAVDALEQAIAHGQRNRDNLLLLSRIYETLGDAEKARGYREEAR